MKILKETIEKVETELPGLEVDDLYVYPGDNHVIAKLLFMGNVIDHIRVIDGSMEVILADEYNQILEFEGHIASTWSREEVMS